MYKRQLNAELVEAYNNRAYAKAALGDFQGAVDDLTRLLQVRPDNPEAYYNRGIAKKQLGDISGAIGDLQKAATLGDRLSVKVLEELGR